MGRLADLHDRHGQSPWLDNLRRDWLASGELAGWVQRGVRGITSNPTIFQKAMTATDAYEADLHRLVAAGHTTLDAYWELVIDDITSALDLLEPVHTASGGEDGFVSVEVAPSLARDTDGTIEAARALRQRIPATNLYIKIPATSEGLPAITTMIAEGASVNVTLIFGLERYGQVIDAYLAGLEQREGDLSTVSSVASFFISRVDTEVDRRLDEIGTVEALELRGTAAIAQARAAYSRFQDRFQGPRWDALGRRGARRQRPLWASTSTKNPAYPDTLYVDQLIGPDTVNTMPESTLAAFDDHGTLDQTIDQDDGSEALARLSAVGVDLGDVARVLEDQGVDAFAASFDDLVATLDASAAAVSRS
ncbi:MAG: transaldolase [Acidimicrobiales bacterium]|nr:transaldolase [Acidimicrobiales bacterium]